MQPKIRRYTIVVLVLFTASLHFAAAFDRRLFHPGAPSPDLLFTLNGFGFVGLLGAYVLPIRFFQQRRRLVGWALFAYICLTITAWLVIWVGFNVLRDGKPFFDLDSLYGVPSKVAEIALLCLLWQDKA